MFYGQSWFNRCPMQVLCPPPFIDVTCDIGQPFKGSMWCTFEYINIASSKLWHQPTPECFNNKTRTSKTFNSTMSTTKTSTTISCDKNSQTKEATKRTRIKTSTYNNNTPTIIPGQKGREPWFSGLARRLMSWRWWVRILALYNGWTFFTFICCKNVLMFVWKDQK